MQAKHSSLTCHCCGKKGHIAPNCSEKDKTPRKNWWIKQAVQTHQATKCNKTNNEISDQTDIETQSSFDRRSKQGRPRQGCCNQSIFQGLQINNEDMEVCFVNNDNTRQSMWCHLRDVLLIDSGST